MEKDRLVKIALGQFTSVQGDTTKNLQKILDMTDKAAAQNADLIVFPELAYSGYFCNSLQMQELAEPQDGPFVQTLCKKAKEKKIHIIAGYPESCGIPGRIYNSAIFIDDGGKVIENMRKVYAWGTEKLKFREGNRYPVVNTKFGKVGMLICYDVEYPEPARIEALKGAEIIVDCSVWSIDPAEHRWHVDLQANALFNLLFTVGCNTVGDNVCGSSMIVGPDGEERVVASRTEEELLIHEINLNEIIEIRSRIPYMNDFKESTFSMDAINKY
ncbi:nitrilase-related carbon-nitrogen hydrolase [Acidaminococcus timonensis]|uniref:nitrilase-related carbon-nitrogen hydrolase n=1 Tax=Acidaminococcus timonensis TaxID=1871002 RepID=UPI0008D94AA6|nr:nitrilase-related carbon-nitrogen hydrolase [Acidaminococcus timonensis]